MKELELLSLDGLKSFFKRDHDHFVPEEGSVCDNCQTELQGLYCYRCGQTADPHHRSILHLTWEAIEGLLHLDGRLWRTVPALFFRPGRLNRDLLERKIARHVPPLRLFLVSLLLFMFAAEHKLEQMREEGVERAHAAAEIAHDPVKLKAAVDRINTQAAADYKAAVLEARADYDDSLKDADNQSEKDTALRIYNKDLAEAAKERDDTIRDSVQAAQRGETADLDLFAMTPDQARAMAEANDKAMQNNRHLKNAKPDGFLMKLGHAVNKALGNLDLFYVTLFTWGHRLAILLLPIMGFSLGLLYVHKRQYYIYDHLLVSANLLSFLFLTNALALAMPGQWGGYLALVLMFWTPVNIFMTLRGGYGSSIFGAVLKTLILWFLATMSFTILLLGVVYVAMTSL